MGAKNSVVEVVAANVIVVEREALLKAHPVDDDLRHWHIWSQLDMHDEATAVRLSKFMRNLMDLVVPDAAIRDSDTAMSGELDLSSVKLHDAIHMDWPLKASQIEEMIRDFELSADAVHIPLPRESYHKLLVQSTEYYAAQPNVIPLQVWPCYSLSMYLATAIDSPRLYVDGGGRFARTATRLAVYFQDPGPAVADQLVPLQWRPCYVVVDRGSCSVEICAIVLAYQSLFPDAVHVNRGNHEDEFMNSVHSFRQEVLVKYDADMFDAFNALFNALPLAHVVNRSIFVVHGGLSDAPLTLAQINTIPRHEYHLHVPNDRRMSEELHWMQDLLWSDPQVPLGLATSRRGAGVVFGPDVCAAFLRLNQLKMVVRSHEVIREGFMWTFDVDEVTADGRVPEVPPSHVPLDMGDVPESMLLTLFSCSNYCHDSNRGGILVLDAVLNYHIHTYSVPPKRSLIRGLPAFRSIEDHNRHNIMQLLLSHKSKLAQAFAALDESKASDNMVTVDTWAAVLRQVLELDLDWKELAPRMAAVDAQGRINYVKFLASFRAVTASGTGCLMRCTRTGRRWRRSFASSTETSRGRSPWTSSSEGVCCSTTTCRRRIGGRTPSRCFATSTLTARDPLASTSSLKRFESSTSKATT
ncbi:hypothetical protein, variant 1 [Aphanomyces astaci]|uniref:Serine/threonine-protein phosphatase n=1 Tax=Aphanomyces astaci TaxID=112090 RepID=W4H934_APHAT|nr:hypothetical protein, variant 1 [Aphanomyces astaci]ETV87603.1 hypothetical protein, variant 1 [Aphanomyces astaci]|eukprot:XP_009822468.1 hypothetical protein, variant 1 [Aphanomyces astaci]